jgi:signal transduction histidine kinase
VLEDVIGSALRRTRPLLAGHRVEVRAPAELTLLLADGLLMEQVLVNLLENAARHGRRAGQQLAVDVTLSVDGAQAVLQVDDHGPGVPPGQRERIFEPFYRLPGASEREGGVGLGLALVRSIAQRHGGSVRCGEYPGGGARFTLCLPLADAGRTGRVEH